MLQTNKNTVKGEEMKKKKASFCCSYDKNTIGIFCCGDEKYFFVQ
jgi:hypothetical protein